LQDRKKNKGNHLFDQHEEKKGKIANRVVDT